MLVKEETRPGGSIELFNIMRLGPDQGLYLLGERHDFNKIGRDGDEKNFRMLSQLLFKAERDKDERTYHVFVEHVADVQSSLEKKVAVNMMHALIPLSQGHHFKHVVVESCEVRTIIGAFQHLELFYPTYDTCNHSSSEKFALRFQETFGFDITKLTFRDIISEYDRLTTEMNAYRDQWENPLIKDEFNKSLAEAERCFAYLRGYLLGTNPCGKSIVTDDWTAIPVIAPTNFDVDETIYNFCCKDPNKRYIPFLRWISTKMIEGFSNFVDLFLLHRILQLRKEKDPVKKIVVIGGSDHGTSVYWHLLRAQCGQEVYGLTTSQEKFTFDKLLKIWKPLSEIEEQEKAKRKSWCAVL